MRTTILLPVFFEESRIVSVFRKYLDMPYRVFYPGSYLTLGCFDSREYTVNNAVHYKDKEAVVTLNMINTTDSNIILELIRDEWERLMSVEYPIEPVSVDLEIKIQT